MSLSTSLWIFTANDLVFFIPLLLVAGWLLDYREDAFFAFVAVAVSVVVSYGLGLLYAHPAPYQVQQAMVSGTPENSFPSQHTTVMFAFTLALVRREYRRLGAGFLVLATLVGVARVVVGYHWPVDILGGVAAAIVGVVLVAAVGDSVDTLADVFVGIDDRLRAIAGLD